MVKNFANELKYYVFFTKQTKELSFCLKLKYYYLYILATQCRRLQIFQTIISVRSNNLSLKYQRVKPTGCRDIEIRKFEVVAKPNSFSNLFEKTNVFY